MVSREGIFRNSISRDAANAMVFATTTVRMWISRCKSLLVRLPLSKKCKVRSATAQEAKRRAGPFFFLLEDETYQEAW